MRLCYVFLHLPDLDTAVVIAESGVNFLISKYSIGEAGGACRYLRVKLNDGYTHWSTRLVQKGARDMQESIEGAQEGRDVSGGRENIDEETVAGGALKAGLSECGRFGLR